MSFSQNGETALHVAVLGGHTAIAKILLQKGADPKLKNADGVSPIDLAFRSKINSLCDLFSDMRMM